MATFEYVGTELELFAHAQRWKAYWSSRVKPHLTGDVLEAGAGLGVNTRLLRDSRQTRWVCLEPDAALVEQMRASFEREPPPVPCETVIGTTSDLASDRFDAIIYIDVLEHIEGDAAEVHRAYNLLKPGGKIIGLSPAHQWLFSPFDAAIGHCRRYSTKTFGALKPPGAITEDLRYLDAVGLLASLANRLLLKQRMPEVKQILLWDRWMVPLSRALVDPLTFGAVGKSVFAVWRKPAA